MALLGPQAQCAELLQGNLGGMLQAPVSGNNDEKELGRIRNVYAGGISMRKSLVGNPFRRPGYPYACDVSMRKSLAGLRGMSSLRKDLMRKCLVYGFVNNHNLSELLFKVLQVEEGLECP